MAPDPIPCLESLETLEVTEFTSVYFINQCSYNKYVLSPYYVADIVKFLVPASVDLSI